MHGFIDVKDLGHLSIVELLYRLGHQPVYKSGKEFFYHSMLRQTKRNTPSFTVWDEGGKWKDWGGSGKTDISGGGVVQLGMALWPERNFVEVLSHINQLMGAGAEEFSRAEFDKTVPLKNQEGSFGFELLRTAPVGSNYILTSYLNERGILDVADKFLKEVYYQRTDPSKQGEMFAVGWTNASGGWEFTNAKGFKSSIGAKDISIITGKIDLYAVFEGMMDFLSWRKMNQTSDVPSTIILNSIAMVDRALAKLSGASRIDLFLDRDKAGIDCAKKIVNTFPSAIDRSYEYDGFKDYNDKLMSSGSVPCHGDPIIQVNNNKIKIHR